MLRVEEDGRWESYNTTDLHLSLTHWPQSTKEEGKTYSREPRGTWVQRLKLWTFQRFSSLCRHNGEQLALPHTLSHNYRKIYLHSEGHLWIFPLLVLCIYKSWHVPPGIFVHIITRHEWQLFIDRTAIHFSSSYTLNVLRSATFILCWSKECGQNLKASTFKILIVGDFLYIA